MTRATEEPPDQRHKFTRSLANRNVRLYIIGQGISHTGMWLQMTAELWVVLQLTDSGTALGVVMALRFTPVLLLGAYGGVISDRLDRRRLLLATQSVAALTIALFAVLWLRSPSLTLVYVVVTVQGLVNAVDNPVRRSFVRDLATDAELSNAISVISTIQTVSRTVGPALAGMTISVAGPEWCFVANAVSYVAVLASLSMLERSALRERVAVVRAPRQLREGLVYAWQTPTLRRTLALMAVVGVFGWNWTAILPVYAVRVFAGDAALYGSLVGLLSFGSFIGGIMMARTLSVGHRHILSSGSIVALALGLTAAAPTIYVAISGLILLGAAGTAFTIGSQTRIQLNAADQLQGRVMALLSVAWIGGKPLGGLIGGWLIDVAGPREAFAVSAIAVALAIGSVAAVRFVQAHRGNTMMGT